MGRVVRIGRIQAARKVRPRPFEMCAVATVADTKATGGQILAPNVETTTGLFVDLNPTNRGKDEPTSWVGGDAHCNTTADDRRCKHTAITATNMPGECGRVAEIIECMQPQGTSWKELERIRTHLRQERDERW